MNQSFLVKTPQVVDPQNVVKALGELLGQYMVQNVTKAQTVGAPIGPYIHGPGGLFGVRGLSRGVISTHTQITGSLGEVIPIGATGAQRQDNELNPLFPYITGFLRSDQQEKNAVCDNPVQASNFKTCIQTTVFGRKEFKTRQVEINHIGQSINRGEFFDLDLLNGPLVQQMGGLMSNMFSNLSSQNAILAGREMVGRILEVAVAYQRWFCPTVYTGNPTNNSAGGGYKEFPGLDLLISTTKVDALAGTACPSLYSTILNFSYRKVDDANDPDVVKTITTMMRILKRKAAKQGLDPVDIRMVMREELFYVLTEVWPCRYMSYRCSAINPAAGTTGASESIMASDAIAMKNAMRDGSYLLVDNLKVPVVLDDCIAEDNHNSAAAVAAGCFASDIYFVPFTARGGTIRTLYWEYYDYSKDVIPAVGDAHATSFFWSDGGVFLWGIKPPDNWCLEMISKVEPRIILRTPQLAGRLQHISYCPLLHTDDPLPKQNYFVNGGVSTGRVGPSPFSEWNLAGPGMGN